MNHEGTIALFQYWDRLRKGRPAPLRTEIEPADIRQLLADTFILERDLRSEAIFRLAGTRLCATYGRELRGYAFALVWATRDQQMMARLAHNIFENNSIVVVTFRGTSQSGRTCGFEMILLPLASSEGGRRLIGAVQPLEKPFWLGADAIFENTIETVRVVDPDREPIFLKNRPALRISPASPSAEPLPPQSAPRKVRHLVVIEGGRDM